MAHGVLVPQPGIEPRPLAVKAPSPNHRTARASLEAIFKESEEKGKDVRGWCNLIVICSDIGDQGLDAGCLTRAPSCVNGIP